MPTKAKASLGQAAWRSKASVIVTTPLLRNSPKAKFRKIAQSLAWIVEKWHTWSDCDGDVERRYNVRARPDQEIGFA